MKIHLLRLMYNTVLFLVVVVYRYTVAAVELLYMIVKLSAELLYISSKALYDSLVVIFFGLIELQKQAVEIFLKFTHALVNISKAALIGALAFIGVELLDKAKSMEIIPAKIGYQLSEDFVAVKLPQNITADTMADVYMAAIYAKKGQTVEIVADTNGGYTAAAVALVNLIKVSPAHFQVRITNYAASAGAYLACSIGNVTSHSPDAKVMVHRARADFGYSNLNELINNAATMSIYDDNLWNVCKPYMTEDQWFMYTLGNDTWFPATQLNDPLTFTKSVQKRKALERLNTRSETDPQEDIDKATRPLTPERLPK